MNLYLELFIKMTHLQKRVFKREKIEKERFQILELWTKKTPLSLIVLFLLKRFKLISS